MGDRFCVLAVQAKSINQVIGSENIYLAKHEVKLDEVAEGRGENLIFQSGSTAVSEKTAFDVYWDKNSDPNWVYIEYPLPEPGKLTIEQDIAEHISRDLQTDTIELLVFGTPGWYLVRRHQNGKLTDSVEIDDGDISNTLGWFEKFADTDANEIDGYIFDEVITPFLSNIKGFNHEYYYENHIIDTRKIYGLAGEDAAISSFLLRIDHTTYIPENRKSNKKSSELKPPNKGNFDEWMERINQRMSKGDYLKARTDAMWVASSFSRNKKALKAYLTSNVLSGYPHSPDPYDAIAYILYGNDEWAIECFGRALYGRGSEYYFDALQVLKRGINLSKENPSFPYFIGRIYFENGEFDKAVNNLTIAVSIDPKNIDYQLSLAEALVNHSEHNEAKKVCKTISEFPKLDHTIYHEAGTICLKVGELELAAKLFRQALEQVPDMLRYKDDLIFSEKEIGRTNELHSQGKKYLFTAESSKPDKYVFFNEDKHPDSRLAAVYKWEENLKQLIATCLSLAESDYKKVKSLFKEEFPEIVPQQGSINGTFRQGKILLKNPQDSTIKAMGGLCRMFYKMTNDVYVPVKREEFVRELNNAMKVFR